MFGCGDNFGFDEWDMQIVRSAIVIETMTVIIQA